MQDRIQGEQGIVADDVIAGLSMDWLQSKVFKYLLVVGLVLLISGCHELELTGDSSGEPEEVSLKDLEDGKMPKGNYVKLGSHVALYSVSYGYTAGDSQERTHWRKSRRKIVSLYVPVVSRANRCVFDFGSGSRKTASSTQKLAVVVLTKDPGSARSIPKKSVKQKALIGMVTSRGLTFGNAKEAFEKSFPKVDLSKVLIVEEGRTPTSPGMAYLMIAGGVIFTILGIFGFIEVKPNPKPY